MEYSCRKNVEIEMFVSKCEQAVISARRSHQFGTYRSQWPRQSKDMLFQILVSSAIFKLDTD